MRPTDHTAATSPQSDNPDAFSDLIRRVLDLPSKDQQRLHAMLAAMLDAAPQARDESTAPSHEDAAEEERRDTQAWLAAIDLESPARQMKLIDEIIPQVEYQSSMELLEARRRTLLDNHPPLAVRGAVTRLASESPMQLVLGVAGLCVAIVSLAVWVFNRIF